MLVKGAIGAWTSRDAQTYLVARRFEKTNTLISFRGVICRSWCGMRLKVNLFGTKSLLEPIMIYPKMTVAILNQNTNIFERKMHLKIPSAKRLSVQGWFTQCGRKQKEDPPLLHTGDNIRDKKSSKSPRPAVPIHSTHQMRRGNLDFQDEKPFYNDT